MVTRIARIYSDMNPIVLVFRHIREIIVFAVSVRCGADVTILVYPGICENIHVPARTATAWLVGGLAMGATTEYHVPGEECPPS